MDVTSVALPRDNANNRQLEAALWKAMSEAPDRDILAPSEWRSEATSGRPGAHTAVASRPPAEPTADEIRAALASVGGSVGKAARNLGLSSRFALYRLMKKHGIEGVE
jgi:transcriptional regulator of acetoin/glycerol metabolism